MLHSHRRRQCSHQSRWTHLPHHGCAQSFLRRSRNAIGSETSGGADAIRVTDLSIEGADNGIRIKSNSTRGGLVRDVVYEDVCIRETKNPILMDTHYSASHGPDRDRIPQFTDIVLKNVGISGGGKITLNGYDERHRLGMTFDNVHVDSSSTIEWLVTHADLTLGPGPLNFRPTGPDVTIHGTPGRGVPNPCAAKFLPMPGRADSDSRPEDHSRFQPSAPGSGR